MNSTQAQAPIRCAALVVLATVCPLVPAASGQHHKSRNYEPVEVVLARVPDKARAKRNPLENDPDAVTAGQKLFEQHCAECRGETAGGAKRGPSLRADGINKRLKDKSSGL